MNTLVAVQAAKVEEEMGITAESSRNGQQRKRRLEATAERRPNPFKSRFTELNSCHLHLSDSLDIASPRKV